jgi:hypothetical protein
VPKSRVVRAQELTDGVLIKIIDQEKDNPIPLALAKMKVNSVSN